MPNFKPAKNHHALRSRGFVAPVSQEARRIAELLEGFSRAEALFSNPERDQIQRISTSLNSITGERGEIFEEQTRSASGHD